MESINIKRKEKTESKIKDSMVFVLLLVTLLLLLNNVIFATKYYSTAGQNNPNACCFWSLCPSSHVAVHSLDFTNPSDTFLVQASHSGTTTNNWNVSGTVVIEGNLTFNHYSRINNLIILGGGLVVANSATTIPGLFNIGINGKYILNHTTDNDTTTFIGSLLFDSYSTFEYKDICAGGLSNVPGLGYYNLIWNTNNEKNLNANAIINGDLTIEKGVLNINKNLTINGNVNISDGILVLNNDLTSDSLYINGNLNINGGEFVLDEIAGNSYLEIGGDYNQSAGTLTMNNSTINNQQDTTELNIVGSFVQNGGTITEGGSNTGRIKFNQGYSQSFHQNGVISNDVVIESNLSDIVLTTNINIGSKLIVKANSSITTNNYVISGNNSTFVLEPEATIFIGSINGINKTANSGNIQTTNRIFNSKANYVYNCSVNSSSFTGDGLPDTIKGRFTVNNNLYPQGGAMRLSKPLVISGSDAELRLTIGRLVTDSVNLITLSNNALVLGGSHISFIDGPLKVVMNTTKEYLFPLGKNNADSSESHYKRIGLISTNNDIKEFLVNYYLKPYTNVTSFDTTITDVSKIEYWDIKKIRGESGIKIKLYWEANDPSFCNLENLSNDHSSITDHLTIAHYKNNKWQDAKRLYVDTIFNYIVCEYLNSFSPFTFGSDNAQFTLPIEIKNFTASSQNNDILLKWETYSESNNDYFVIERALDGKTFSCISKQKGAGNSNSINSYNYTDITVSNIINTNIYYRLKQVDFDGNYKYSNTISVSKTFANNSEISKVYFNNENKSISLNINCKEGSDATVQIFDISGKIVKSENTNLTKGDNEIAIKAHTLSNGTYIINIPKLNFSKKINIF